MKRIIDAALVAAVAGLLAAGPARASNWTRAESAHFIAVSDAHESKARDYLRQLEAFRYVALLTLGADPASTRVQSKLDIVLLKNQDEILKVRSDFSREVAGWYAWCGEGSTAFATLQRTISRDGVDPGLVTLFHEYAHHLMFQATDRWYPAWYVEGFAEYMSTAEVEDDKVSLGQPFSWRSQVLAQDRWIDFARVLAPDFKGASVKDHDDWTVQSFYAQSWLLAHYMLNDSERTRRFNDYFARVAAGEDPVAAFEPATGIAVGSLQRVLKRYMENMPVIVVRTRAMQDAAPTSEALPDDVPDLALSAARLRTCLPRLQGEELLAQLRARPGASQALRLVRDRAELLFGDPRAAAADLLSHVGDDDQSFEAHYLLGRVDLAAADKADGDARVAAMDQAREQLLKAYRLKKVDAPNLYYLSYALPGGGHNSNVLNAARGAHALSPSVSEYALHEARLDLQADARDKAVQALMPLASNPHDAKQAARMRAAIATIRAGAGEAEVERALKGGD